jgi:ABC-type multidrug transport system ATPase subunit
VIALENVSARSAPARGRAPHLLRNATFSWQRGVLAVVGAPVDGTGVLLDVIAGVVPARAGRVTIRGLSPEASRRTVAYVPYQTMLPEVLRVGELTQLAPRLRGEPVRPVAEVLAPLGLESLAKRRVRSLGPAEQRAVALAIALASRARVLLVDEPLAMLDPGVPSRVTDALRARAAEGVLVVVTTASVRDATRVADELAVMTQGGIAPLPPRLLHVGYGGARLRVVVARRASPDAPSAASLVAKLAESPAVATIESATHDASDAPSAPIEITVSGRDLLALASAVGRAVAQTNVVVEAIEPGVMPLDAIRAALAMPRSSLLPSSPPPPLPASGPPPGPGAAP